MEFTRITRKYVKIPVTATLPDGDPATISGVDVALLPKGYRPNGSTVWTASDYTGGTATVLIAGPDADATDAMVLATESDLWIRVTDTPEVDAVKVTRLTVSPAPAAPVPQTGVVYVTTASLDEAVTALGYTKTGDGTVLPQFHGVRYVAYGHSFGEVQDPPNVWAGSLYPLRLRDLLHADPSLFANECQSGTTMPQIATHAAATWVPGDYGLVSLLGNQNSAGNGQDQTTFKNAVRNFLNVFVGQTNPPTILIIKDTTNTDAGYAIYADGTYDDAVVATFNQWLVEVVAEYPDAPIVVADPIADGWDPDTMTADGLHPNDRGMAHIVSSCLKALATAPYRLGLNLGIAGTSPTPPSGPPAMSTLRGTPTYSAGKFGNAMSGGVIGATTTAFVSTSQGTVEAWVKSDPGFVDIGVAVGDGTVWLGQDAGGVAALGVPGDGLFSTVVINDGSWHHLAYTWAGTAVQLWVDGVSVAAGTAGTAPAWGAGGTVGIGGWGDTTGFDWAGAVDEVRFSDVVRYTGTFTPATGPFTEDANTLGLYHLDS